jgi:hypothetical protein
VHAHAPQRGSQPGDPGAALDSLAYTPRQWLQGDRLGDESQRDLVAPFSQCRAHHAVKPLGIADRGRVYMHAATVAAHHSRDGERRLQGDASETHALGALLEAVLRGALRDVGW